MTSPETEEKIVWPLTMPPATAREKRDHEPVRPQLKKSKRNWKSQNSQRGRLSAVLGKIDAELAETTGGNTTNGMIGRKKERDELKGGIPFPAFESGNLRTEDTSRSGVLLPG